MCTHEVGREFLFIDPYIYYTVCGRTCLNMSKSSACGWTQSKPSVSNACACMRGLGRESIQERRLMPSELKRRTTRPPRAQTEAGSRRSCVQSVRRHTHLSTCEPSSRSSWIRGFPSSRARRAQPPRSPRRLSRRSTDVTAGWFASSPHSAWIAASNSPQLARLRAVKEWSRERAARRAGRPALPT